MKMLAGAERTIEATGGGRGVFVLKLGPRQTWWTQRVTRAVAADAAYSATRVRKVNYHESYAY